jgi:hypothetical protein
MRLLLWGEWDPLDLRVHAPNDEYDSYFNVVAGKLRRHESAAEIAEYLSVTKRQIWGSDPTLGPATNCVRLPSG